MRIMTFNIDIKPEQIEEMIVSAALGSALGDAIKKEIETVLGKLERADSPLRMAINAEIQRVFLNLLRDEYADKFKEEARRQLTEKVVGDVAQAALSAFWDQMSKLNSGRGY